MAGELKAEISIEFVQELGKRIADVDSSFDEVSFVEKTIDSEWNGLELKARIKHVASRIGSTLDLNYPESIETLKPVSIHYSGMQALVFPEYVEQYGLNDWENSMDALAAFTSLCSSEFAVRPFIRMDQERMLAQMLEWSESSDRHLRRLASEGCRPRLPWGSPLRRFIKNPEPVLPILSKLYNDDEEYVRRSVANNLNDISKDHPETALQLAYKWIEASEYSRWVVKHGLRTLLKKGNTDALTLFGYGHPEDIDIRNFGFKRSGIHIGESENFSFDLKKTSEKTEKIRLEYVVYFRKANGKQSKKIFQVGEKEVSAGLNSFEKKHSFRQMTTRKHYPGEHAIAIVVNGIEFSKVDFELLPQKS